MKNRLLGILAFVALAVSAHATTIINGLEQVSLDTSRGQWVTFSVDGSDRSTFAGVQNVLVKLDGINALPRGVFCVDLFRSISAGVYDLDLAPATGNTPIANAERAFWLVRNRFTSVVTPDIGAALQLALWDIVVDGGDGLGNGRIQAGSLSSTITTLVAGYLTDSTGRSDNGGTLYLLSRPDGKGGRTEFQTLIDLTVPEPSTYALMGAGLMAAVILRRRMQRQVN